MNKLFRRNLKLFAWQTPLLLILIFGILQVSASSIGRMNAISDESTQGMGEIYYFPIVANGGSFDTPPTPPGPVSLPEILSFTASPDAIEVGESVELNWEIEGVVTTATINNGVGDVTLDSSVTISPSETTTYEITAVNPAGSVSAELTVVVNEPPPPPSLPIIISFTASKTSVSSGGKVTLNWEATNFDTLRLNHGIGAVTNLTSMDVFPTENTTYRLRAINADGEVSETVTISINGGGGGGGSTGGPQIVVFDLDRKVTEADRGFPWKQPPMENGNWETPYNYAGGTLYVRAEIHNQPVPQQDMRLQFCFWQELNGNNFGLETCITTQNVPGTSEPCAAGLPPSNRCGS